MATQNKIDLERKDNLKEIVNGWKFFYDEMNQCTKLPILYSTKLKSKSYPKFKLEICKKNDVVKIMENQDTLNDTHSTNMKQ